MFDNQHNTWGDNSQTPITPRGTGKDPDLAAALERGWRVIAEAEERNTWRTVPWWGGAEVYAQNVLEGYDRCLQRTRYAEYKARDGRHGNFLLPIQGYPCGAPGCPTCSFHNAAREMESKWFSAIVSAYGRAQTAVVELAADGLTFTLVKEAWGKARRRKHLKSLNGTVGFCQPTSDGWMVRILVPGEVLTQLEEVDAAWGSAIAEVGGEGRVQVKAVDGEASALALLAELRVQADQALPLLVESGVITPGRARGIIETCYRRNRILFLPGFKAAAGSTEHRKPQMEENMNTEPENTQAQPEEDLQNWHNRDQDINSDLQEDKDFSIPCPACGDPSCRAVPTGRMFWWTNAEKLATKMGLVEREDGLLVPPEFAKPPDLHTM